MKYRIFLFLILSSSTLFSQVGGETIYNFLNVPTSARQAALGGKILNINNDVNQPIWNPSIISNKIDNQFSINYLNYLADINFASISYAHMINRKIGTFHSSLSYVNYGKFIEADEQGNETGTFKASDLAVTIGYAYNIAWSDFYIGSNVKIINSVIENYSSFGVAFDAGIYYYNDNEPYSFTIVLRNFGSQITTYDGRREKLPFTIDLGASYKLENVPLQWYFTIDNLQQWDISESNPSNAVTDLEGNTINEKISLFNNAIRHVIIGAEFFPESSFNLRLGYNFRRAKELQLVNKRTFAGFSAGFGLKMNRLKLNYAFTKYHPVSNTSTFSLLIDLNK